MIGAFKLNSIGKFTVTAVAEVIRKKKGITAIGNAQVDTAQSKFGGASALFDGTGDGLSIQPSTDFILGTNDWTVEFWIRPISTGYNTILFDTRATTGANALTLYYTSNTLTYFTGGSIRITGSNWTVNTWQHIALVRNGNDHKLYINGTQSGSTYTATNSITSVQNFITVGCNSDTPYGASFNGHMDEVRVSNSARYTANFTPSTTPFVNDANTLLLIHADGTDASTFFEDDNGVRKSATPFGTGTQNVSTTQSKFGGSSIFINASTGGSNTALNFLPVAEYSTLKWGDYTNYTIECWTYHTAWQPSGANNTGEGSSSVFQWSRQNGFTKNSFGFNEAGKITLDYSTSSAYGGITIQESGASGSLNTWQHIAMVKTGTSLKLYVNGTERASGTISGTVNYGDGAEWPRIGQGYWGGTFYMNDFRCSTVARYSSNFTAPTQPFVNDANTVVLLHGNGSNNTTVYRDDNGAVPVSTRTAKTLTAFGNAQISTAQSQFGGSSVLFDGTGDYVQVSSNSDFTFGTGNFTVEGWIRVTNLGSLRIIWNNQNTSNNFNLYVQTNGSLNMYVGGSQRSSISGEIVTNTWYHIAAVRNGGTTTVYKNGNSVLTFTVSYDATGLGNPTLGSDGGTGNSFNGYIDEFRVSNIARYTANFTAPTQPFVNDPNTVLLIHADGANASTTFTDDTLSYRTQKGITAVGNAQIDTAQSKFGGASALFDGSGDYLTVANNSSLTISGNHTIECWIRLNATPVFPSNNTIYHTDFLFYMAYYNNGGSAFYELDVFQGGQNRVSTLSSGNLSLATNTWYHVAFVRNGSNYKIFLNGIGKADTTYDVPITSQAGNHIGGSPVYGSTNWHIDEFRISNTARYTANFTAPTAPFQNDDNTVLLIHCDGTDGSTVFFDDNGRTPTP